MSLESNYTTPESTEHSARISTFHSYNFMHSTNTIVVVSWEKWLCVLQDHVTEKFHSQAPGKRTGTGKQDWGPPSPSGPRAAPLSRSPQHSTAPAEPPASAEDPKKTALALKRINCQVASNTAKKSNLSLAWLPYPTEATAYIYSQMAKEGSG